MSSSVDYYGTLGVLPSAENVVIRAAYRALALRYHPDQWKGERRIAEEFMRQLNAAYEVLSDPKRRKQYDQERQKGGYQYYEGDENDAGAGFTENERVEAAAWQMALEYFPDLAAIFKRLQTTSNRLAISYRATLLETKQFGQREKLADQLETRFLQSYFGKNAVILEFARQLIKAGDRLAARELNRAVTLLGEDAPDVLISRIKAKFAPAAPRGEVTKLANKLVQRRYVSDAIELVQMLGGEVNERDLSWLPFAPTRIEVKCLRLVAVFDGHDKMVDWVVAHIVPKVLSGNFKN